MINGVWYGFEESATNKPDASMTYGAVRCVKWSNNNADIEVISMMNPTIRYINHFIDITGWEGWKKVSTYTGTSDPITLINSLTSRVTAAENSVNNYSDVIKGRAFSFKFTLKTGHHNYQFSVPSSSGIAGSIGWTPIALKTLSITFSSNSGNFSVNGWAFGVESGNDLWLNIHNESLQETVTLECIVIYASLYHVASDE